MRRQKSAYELRRSQVKTPPHILSFFWQLVREHRTMLRRVLDLGAGDCRFAIGGCFKFYEGIEIDPTAVPRNFRSGNAKVTIGCAFKHSGEGYDACIGNPPYVRHHDLELRWKRATAQQIEKQLSICFDMHANLYLYFVCLALTKTAPDGLLALVIPFEWVSRPSASPLRKHIQARKWNVAVYRFQSMIFKDVLTTASITIIDKRTTEGRWTFHDVRPDLTIAERTNEGGGRKRVLPYWTRGKRVWARRGISPGAQDIFALTDKQRIAAGLLRRDVIRCVTSLRRVPRTLKQLSKRSFEKHFVDAGQKCWLVRCRKRSPNKRIRAYLDSICATRRNTYTCLNQQPWHAYEWMPIPKLLFHCAFTRFGPKVLINSAGAQAVGCVYGISGHTRMSTRTLQSALRRFRFEDRVVPHAGKLKKVEVRQLNAVLKRIDAGRG